MKRIFILKGKASEVLHELHQYKQHCLKYDLEPTMTNFIELQRRSAAEVPNG